MRIRDGTHPGGTLASTGFVKLLELVVDVVQIAGMGHWVVGRGRRVDREERRQRGRKR